MRRLSPLQRAFLWGFRRGHNKALAVMRSKADQWEAEIDELQDDYVALLNEMRSARDARAIEEAAIERMMIKWIN